MILGETEVVPQGTAIYTQTHLLGSSSISGKGKNIANKREIVQALMDSVQKGDFENAKSMLADDFRFSGPVPEPIKKEARIEMSIGLNVTFEN